MSDRIFLVDPCVAISFLVETSNYNGHIVHKISFGITEKTEIEIIFLNFYRKIEDLTRVVFSYEISEMTRRVRFRLSYDS